MPVPSEAESISYAFPPSPSWRGRQPLTCCLVLGSDQLLDSLLSVADLQEIEEVFS